MAWLGMRGVRRASAGRLTKRKHLRPQGQDQVVVTREQVSRRRLQKPVGSVLVGSSRLALVTGTSHTCGQ